MICLQFRAHSDERGSPRRCFAVIDTRGRWRAVIEGRFGEEVKAWAKVTRNTVEIAGGEPVEVSVEEYMRLVRYGERLAEDQKNKRQASNDRRNEGDRANRRHPS